MLSTSIVLAGFYVTIGICTGKIIKKIIKTINEQEPVEKALKDDETKFMFWGGSILWPLTYLYIVYCLICYSLSKKG